MNTDRISKLSMLVLVASVTVIGCEKQEQKFNRANSNVDKFVEFGEGSASSEEAAADEPNIAPTPPPKKRAARRMKASSGLSAARGAPMAKPTTPTPPRGGDRPNSEEFEDYGVNPLTDTAEDNLSTFAIDVDTGSYTIARRKLDEGTRPPADSVRVEEFVNYFTYDYPAPDRPPFGVSLEAAPSPFSADDNRYLMRVGVQGKRVSTANRKPVHLTLLVDVSGSMSSRDKLGLAKRAMKLLVNNLKEGDTVAIATYAGRVAAVLQPTGVDDRGKILAALDSLQSGGSTAMNSGIKLAYNMATDTFEDGAVNRVLVLSDGDANVGPASHQEILDQLERYVDKGITLSTIGLGMGNYKDTMMEQLANSGNGNYFYIDDIEEARKVFGEQLNSTLQVIAKDVKIQVEFDKEAVSKYRLIGYENRDIADKDFRNDAVDAGEIGAGHSVTAFYEIVLENPEADKIATVRIRHKEPEAKPGDAAAEQAFHLTSNDLHTKLNAASRDFQFGAAVCAFAELLRESPYTEELSFDLVREVAHSGVGDSKARQEFVALIDKAKAIE